MQQFSKWNKGYRYLLMVLDVFSKYGWIIPLKDKKGETVMNAFKTILKEGRKPQYLWTDKGKEYQNKHVKELLDKNKITLYSTENEEKSSVCERWNRTIKSKMWKQFTVQGNTIYRGYYTAARRNEFYFRVVKTILYERAQRVSKILFLTRENKIHIFKPPCNFLFII